MSNNSPLTTTQIGDYILHHEIGRGGFAIVYQGTHIPTNEIVAIKIIDKNQISSDSLNFKRVESEISILKIVNHKNIIKLYEILETPQKIYLVMEYCERGELFDYIVNNKKLTEKQSCIFFQEIIDCIEYLHNEKISHRDIKPENMLLTQISKKNKTLEIKLIDFGISTKYTLNNKYLSTPCGTTTYAPPEMHKGEKYYGLLSDIWSAGVVLYAMVYGYLPFCDDNNEINVQNIIKGVYDLEDEVSEDVRDLIKHCMNINVNERYNLEQIKNHKWFNLVKDNLRRPGIINEVNVIPIDKEVVWYCKEYGFNDDDVVKSVKDNLFDRNYAIYYILLKKMVREGYESIADLRSEKFLDYINDKKNLIVAPTKKNINNKNNIEKVNFKENGNVLKKMSFHNSEGKIKKIKEKFNFEKQVFDRKKDHKKYKTIEYNKNAIIINKKNKTIDYEESIKKYRKINPKNYKYNRKKISNSNPLFFERESVPELRTSFIENSKRKKKITLSKKRLKNIGTSSFDKFNHSSNQNIRNIKQNFFQTKEIKVNKKNNNPNVINRNLLIKGKGHTIIHNRNASAFQRSLRNKNKFYFNSEKIKENSLSPTQTKLYKKKLLNNNRLLPNKKKNDKNLSINEQSKNSSNLLSQSYVKPIEKIINYNNNNKTLIENGSSSSYRDKKKVNLKTNFFENEKNKIKTLSNNNLINLTKFTISFSNKSKKKNEENKINNIVKEVKKNLLKNNNLQSNIEINIKNKPKIYKGPIDFKCIFLNSLIEVIDHLEKSLIKSKVNFSKINQYKYYCSKNGDIFEVEIYLIDNINSGLSQIYFISIFSKQGNIRTNNKFIDILFPIK